MSTSLKSIIVYYKLFSASADPEQGTEGPDPPPPLKNYKNIGFLSNTGPETLKIHKANMPFKWRFVGGPMMVRFKWYMGPLSPHQLKKRRQSC